MFTKITISRFIGKVLIGLFFVLGIWVVFDMLSEADPINFTIALVFFVVIIGGIVNNELNNS